MSVIHNRLGTIVLILTLLTRIINSVPVSRSSVSVTNYQRVTPLVHANFYKAHGHENWLKGLVVRHDSIPITHYHYEVEHPSRVTNRIGITTPSPLTWLPSDRLGTNFNRPQFWKPSSTPPRKIVKLRKPFTRKKRSCKTKLNTGSYFSESLAGSQETSGVTVQSIISFPDDLNSPPRVQNQVLSKPRPTIENEYSSIVFPGESHKSPVLTTSPAPPVQTSSKISTTEVSTDLEDKELMNEFLNWITSQGMTMTKMI